MWQCAPSPLHAFDRSTCFVIAVKSRSEGLGTLLAPHPNKFNVDICQTKPIMLYHPILHTTNILHPSYDSVKICEIG